MVDENQDELRKRFNRSTNRESNKTETADKESKPTAESSSDTSNTSETDKMDETDEKNETDKTDEKNETDKSQSQSSEGLKGRKQVAMYLPTDLRGELGEFYEELDARSTLAGDGGLQKNREFYEGMVEFVLDHRQAFADSLDIEIDEN